MYEKQALDVYTQERRRRPEQLTRADDQEAVPVPFSQGLAASPGALLDTPRLQGHGASPIRVAAMQQMKYSNLRGSTASTIEINLEAAANNPCVTGSPDIDYLGTVVIDVTTRRVDFSGRVDESPRSKCMQLQTGVPASLSLRCLLFLAKHLGIYLAVPIGMSQLM